MAAGCSRSRSRRCAPLATPRRIDSRLRTLLELRALDALGLRPELCRCVRCGTSLEEGNAGEVAFAVADGGPVCAACLRDGEPLLHVHRGTLRALDQGLRFELERLDRLVMNRQALEESRRILERFQRYHTGVELRSERFLDEMLAAAPG